MEFVELVAYLGLAFAGYLIICFLWMTGYALVEAFGPLLKGMVGTLTRR